MASPETSVPTVSLEVPKGDNHNALFGPNGLRAGWRIAIYLLLVAILVESVHALRHYFFATAPRVPGSPLKPLPEIITRGLVFLELAFAALVMTRIEREKWGHYGLPLRRALSLDFWAGCLWGIGGLSVVMAGLWATGAYRIEGLALGGATAWKYAALWAVMFLIVGLVEEFSLRGYLQYALASGVGFWPSALIFSALFLAGHVSNKGENWMGLTDVFLVGMFFCFTLWRTGDLWFAVGMHAVWDWGLTYLYSVPNSGITAVGQLFHVRMQGPAWLSGGTAGPEGSVINLAMDIVYFFVFAAIYKRRKWVGMDDRRRAAEPVMAATVIDASALGG